jgi:tRNA dimethylallyltransferase
MGEGWNEDLPKDESLRAALATWSTEDLYARLQSLDPQRASELHPNDRFRVIRGIELSTLLGQPMSQVLTRRAAPRATHAGAFKPLIVVVDPPRDVLHARIAQRTALMLRQGLVDEVRALLKSGVDPRCKPMRSIGYQQVVSLLDGTLTEGQVVEHIVFATRQYAKRQSTWFRKVEAIFRIPAAKLPLLIDLMK